MLELLMLRGGKVTEKEKEDILEVIEETNSEFDLDTEFMELMDNKESGRGIRKRSS